MSTSFNFRLHTDIIPYERHSDCLYQPIYNNNYILVALGLIAKNPCEYNEQLLRYFTHKIYGYEFLDLNSWPTCRHGDYAALDRMIDELHKLCAMTTRERSDYIDKMADEAITYHALKEF